MTYDFKCPNEECRGVLLDVYFPTPESLEKLKASGLTHNGGDPLYRVECPHCDSKQMSQYYGAGPRNFIQFDTPGMYGKYHPGFGCVVRDYGHKQELLRQTGMREAADAIGGSKSILGDTDVMDGRWEGSDRGGYNEKDVERHKKEKAEAMKAIQWV